MPKWMVRCTGSRVMSRPLKRTRPLVGFRLPLSRLKSVVFPAPFGPMMAWSDPRCTWMLTSSTATSAPNCLRSPTASRITSPAMALSFANQIVQTI
jgi:hypothetical protein